MKVVLIGGGALAVLGLIWLIVTALVVRSQLDKLEQRIASVRVLVAQGKIADARHLAATLPELADDAHSLTRGPAWWVAAHVPYFGEPAEVVRGSTGAAQRIGGRAVPKLIDVASLLDPSRLRTSGNTIRIASLTRAGPDLVAALADFQAARADLSGLPGDTWFGPVNSLKLRLDVQLDSVGGYVEAAARATHVLPRMLGDATPQRYFIGLQNEAELRATGGLPGAFAILRVSHGTFTFEKFESDAALLPPGPDHAIPTGLNYGEPYDSLYGPSLPTSTYLDSNVSPEFPYAARVWAAMWEKVSGEHLDGVLAVDPTTLGYFLAATGPTQLHDGRVISAANVVALTERDNYVLYPDNLQRKKFLVAILRAAAHKLTSGAGNAVDLARAASVASQQHRFLAWSRDPAVERVLSESNFAGVLPSPERPFAGAFVNDAAAGKLDYYLSRTFAYSRTGCGSRRDVVVTIGLTNNAPASGLPQYVVGRADKPPPDAVPGDTHVLLDYYATGGSLLQSAALNEDPTTASVYRIDGHVVVRLDLELPRASTQTITLHLDEPAGRGNPYIWVQPGVVAQKVTTFDQHC